MVNKDTIIKVFPIKPYPYYLIFIPSKYFLKQSSSKCAFRSQLTYIGVYGGKKSVRKMYFSRNALPVSTSGFGAGTGPIWYDNLNCFGNETSLTQCQTKAVGDNDCSHKEDAGVICSNCKK